MGSKQNYQGNLDPSPPRDISKENLGIWTGWTYKSDREVVREAAAKGYVQLALQFLSLRKNVEIERISEYFNKEVSLWIDELLNRKLIFRVSTILENSGIDPACELQNIFCKTTKTERRDYIGNHLKSKNLLNAKNEQLWIFLDIILANKLLIHQSGLEKDSIESLEEKSDSWKDFVAVKLFLSTHDSRLIPLIKAEVLWNQLLQTNEAELLISWIRVNYSSNYISHLTEDFLLLLKSLPITETMIKNLSNSNLPQDSFELILNQLARFGVFIESEKLQFLKILSRINSADSLRNIYDILGHIHSTLPLVKFVRMLIEYCLEHNLLAVLAACTSSFDLSIIPNLHMSPILNLITSFRKLLPDLAKSNLCENIFEVSRYLGKDNLEQYFCDNPMIFLALLVLNENISLQKAISEKSLVLDNTEFYSCLSNVLREFQLLPSLYFRNTKGVKSSLTYFDLLEKHLNFDVKRTFAFHFEHLPLPNFNSPELKIGFAYSKKVNYIFYLKQCRPYFASKRFCLDLLTNSKNISDDDKKESMKKVYRICIKNFENVALTASCVTFLQIIGVNSDYVRVSLKAANILLKSGMEADNVIHLLLNIEKDPKPVQTLLDENMMKFIDFSSMMSSAVEFIKASKLYDVVVKFSNLHNLSLPENFLKNLTQRNLWFPFLLFAQLNNYPAEQIKELCPNFKNPNLLEHVVHSVLHDIQIDETNVLMRERDSRKYILSRLGFRRSTDGSGIGSVRSRSTLSGSLDSNDSSASSEFLEIDISNTKATLLQILIRCHNSTDPPRALLQASQLYRNPLLAILATSYEPDSVITNWLTWLAVSTNSYEFFTNFETISASSQLVTDLLDSCIKNKYPMALFQSCMIFIPDNPLTPFCDFLNRLVVKDFDANYVILVLDRFKILKSQRRASVLSQTDYELTYLKNKLWIENTALQLLCSTIIYNTHSFYDQFRIVDLLCQINIRAYFSCPLPNFENLLIILKTIFDTGVQLNVIDYLDPQKEVESVQNCVNKLVNLGLFTEALAVGQCANLSTDKIIVQKWQNKYESKKHCVEHFVIKCDQEFEDHSLFPELVISFFMSKTANADDMGSYYLIKFAHKWAAKHNLPNRFDLEREKILAYLKTVANISDLEDAHVDKQFTTYKEMLEILEQMPNGQDVVNADCSERLNSLLIEALNKRNFWLALKLERMFNLRNNDLDILKLCHELAEGLVLPYQLNVEQQKIIARVKEIQRISYRRRSTYKSVSTSSDSNYLDLIEEETEYPSQAAQGLIHSLIEKLNNGAELAYTVFMKYRISCNIEMPYDIVVSNTDPLKMLKVALQEDCFNKLEVVHDFFEVFEWSKDDISDFVCDQFVTAATNYSKSKIDIFNMWDVKVSDQFHLILKLIKDECSTLGYKFYNYATAIHKQQVTADLNFKISEMSLVVELLIAAHSCFTADCNMEGISTILRKSRDVIYHLLNVRSWKLIVRLLTGVGRYTELNFVLDILKKNEQFEFLLSKGSKRDERLKTACIEYLKKFCPQDKKLYELVALHFNLYSEVAMVWEREAHGYIKNLLAIALAEMQNRKPNQSEPIEMLVLTKSDGTHMLLHQAMEKYVQAAEFHSQGEKLSNAMNAVKQAELIALQKSLLREVENNGTVPSLLNLSNSKITKLMTTELNFHQSNILAQAYNYIPDWPHILYEQTIANGNVNYFDQFSETIGLTDDIIQDIIRKLPANQVVAQNFRIIKHIIGQLKSMHLKYRIASELGFNDLALEVISSEKIFYLKDTVWKNGYKGRNISKSSES